VETAVAVNTAEGAAGSVMYRAVASKAVVNAQPLVLVLRRENGP